MKAVFQGGGGWCWAAPLAALLVLPIVAGCSRQAESGPDAVRAVKTVLLSAGGEPRVRSFSGRALAAQEAELAFQVSGLLVNLPVREGQKVAKGEVIAQLRQEEFQARQGSLQGQLDQARASLRALKAGARPEEQLRLEADVRAAEARMTNARARYDRFKGLLATDAVSRQEFEVAETGSLVALEELESARQRLQAGVGGRVEDIEAREAEVRSLEARTREAAIQLEDSTLRAPYDGVVARRFVEVNQNVRANEPIARIQNVGQMDIVVDVPESFMAAGLQSGDLLELVAEFSAAPGQRFPLKISEVAKVADPVTQTFRVRAAMEAPPGVNILPGMSATATVTYRRGGQTGNRLLVPISAVYQESAGEQVAWVIGGDQTVQRRPVKLGETAGGLIEIVEGLQPGNRIAVAGVRFLQDGMKVRDLGDALGGSAP